MAKSGLIVKTEGYITDGIIVDPELSVTLVMDNGGEELSFSMKPLVVYQI